VCEQLAQSHCMKVEQLEFEACASSSHVHCRDHYDVQHFVNFPAGAVVLFSLDFEPVPIGGTLRLTQSINQSVLILNSTFYQFSLIILFQFYSHPYSLTVHHLWH